ncbi:MAG: DUF2252 domain-containing protein [Chamaesiphon sp.]|nr:DUF2252 domain-containing protein [Chamaesiphon sp.]
MDNSWANRDDEGARDIWQLIQAFDLQRDRNVLPQKYRKMRKNAFTFFRGTCHLFYRDLPSSIFDSDPIVWICGDLHLENFGAYQGDYYPQESLHQEIYFGINDFDEGVLAPCTWDIARLLTSILLAAASLDLDESAGQRLAQVCLTSYANSLSTGEISSIVQANTSGVIADFLQDLRHRQRSEFLDDRTELIKDRRQLKFDDEKVLKMKIEQRDRVISVIDRWAQTQVNPDFFEVLDVGFRVAGTGSIGVDRYIILVAGKGSPNGNYLLDFKQQPISALQPYLTIEQPQWINQASRVMTVQQLVQSAPPALLAAIEFNDSSYLLRELQPTQDKINLKTGKSNPAQLDELIDTIAKVTAFAHLHGNGKLGAATAQDLIKFGNNLDWQQKVLTYANNYAGQVYRDYQYFCKATVDS